MHVFRPQRLPHDIGWVRHQGIAINRDSAVRAHKTGPPFRTDRLIRMRPAMYYDPAGILVPRSVLFHKNLYRSGLIRTGRPLHNIVMVLTPIQFSNVEAVRARVAVVRNRRRRPQVQIPIEFFGYRLSRTKALRPKNRASIPVSVDLLEGPY